MNLGARRGGWTAPRPGRFTTAKDPVPIVQEAIAVWNIDIMITGIPTEVFSFHKTTSVSLTDVQYNSTSIIILGLQERSYLSGDTSNMVMWLEDNSG
jgi:hypothetical protein